MPFLRLLIPLMAGVIIGRSMTEAGKIIIPAMIVCWLFLVYVEYSGLTRSGRWNILFGIISQSIFFLSGIAVTANKKQDPRPECLRTGVVLRVLSPDSISSRVIINRIREKDENLWVKFNGMVELYLEEKAPDNHPSPGDVLLFFTSLSPPMGPQNPEGFNYRDYCYNKGLNLTGYVSNKYWLRLGKTKTYLIRPAFERWRGELVKLVHNQGFQNSGIINSLLLGYRDDLTDMQRKYFVSSGAMHVLAVSGLHTGILYLLVQQVINIIYRRYSRVKWLIPLPAVWMYAAITGLMPSVSRASLMLSLYMISRFLKRPVNPLNIISGSCFILILVNPGNLFQVSFQLSYAAVSGISLIYPGLFNALKRNIFILDKMAALFCISLSAQLFTLPLSMLYFHQVPHYFFITNLVAVPLVSLIMYNGILFFIMLAAGFPVDFIGGIMDILAQWLARFTGFIAGLPFSHSEGISLLPVEVILFYILIFCLAGYLKKKQKRILYGFLVVVIILMGLSCFKNVNRINQKEMVIYSVKGSSAISFISSNRHILVTEDSSTANIANIRLQAENYWISRRLHEPEIMSIGEMYETDFQEVAYFYAGENNRDCILMRFYELRIGIFNRMPYYPEHSDGVLDLDIIYLYGDSLVSIGELVRIFNPEIIILDRNLPRWIRELLESECKTLNVNYHSIYEKGFYRHRL